MFNIYQDYERWEDDARDWQDEEGEEEEFDCAAYTAEINARRERQSK